MNITFVLMFAATLFIGLLSGASLDQSIKQLPARRRIGLTAYSQYSRATDLGNGILFYGILGVAAALLNIAAAIAAYLQRIPSPQSKLIYVAALLAVLHSLATTRAAPLNFSQRKISLNDEDALGAVFDKFARWQNIRCVLQVLNFAVNLWALVVYLRSG